MRDIPTDPEVTISMYADDCAIWIAGKNIHTVVMKLQKYLDVLSSWFKEWGFTLSNEKTVPVLFTKSTINPLPVIKLEGNVLTYKNNHRFLGMIFDSKLTWQLHIENIVTRSKRKLNILRALTGTKWGSSSKSLLIVYRAIIRSIFDYGCQAYNSAADTTKKKLDSVQYQALRICAGGLPLTSLASLQVEMGEPPLDLRRQRLSSKYRQNIERHVNHPLEKHIKPCWQFDYLKGKNVSKPFGYRLQSKIGKEIILEKIFPPVFPPWLFCPPTISTELTEIIKKSDHPIQQQQSSLELIHTKWSNQFHIYTDGSKVPEKGISSSAFYVPFLHIIKGKDYRTLLLPIRQN